DIFYNSRAIQKANRVSLNLQEAELKEALDQIFENQPFMYSIEDKSVVVQARHNLPQTLTVQMPGSVAPQQGRLVSGRVINEQGERLPFVTLTFLRAGRPSGAPISTNDRGEFQFNVVPGVDSVRFSSVGYATTSFAIPTTPTWTVTLTQQTSEIG